MKIGRKTKKKCGFQRERAIRYSTQKNLDLGKAVGGAVAPVMWCVLYYLMRVWERLHGSRATGSPLSRARPVSAWTPVYCTKQSSVARGRGLGRKANSIATAWRAHRRLLLQPTIPLDSDNSINPVRSWLRHGTRSVQCCRKPVTLVIDTVL